ncbi:MAG TPA: tyrosine-type recombinase/integrase [bacterium]|nr:tyrosine-type recombinase/integrase [bacterium]
MREKSQGYPDHVTAHARADGIDLDGAVDDYLVTDADGQPLRSDSITRVFLNISKRAGLPHPITPHTLRYYFGCAVLTASSDLELRRQLPRHSTLHMSLQYARLTKTDVLRKYQRSSPLDRLTRH